MIITEMGKVERLKTSPLSPLSPACGRIFNIKREGNKGMPVRAYKRGES